MKKVLAFLLAAAMVCSLCACSGGSTAATKEETTASAPATEAPAPANEAPATPANMVNPVTAMADYQALLAAQPTIRLNDAPVGAANVVYSVISNIPAISQIQFQYNGFSYTYRAAFGDDSTDISGVYTVLSSVQSGQVKQENRVGGTYTVRYDTGSGEAVANWYTPLSGCRYSLYTDHAHKDGGTEFQSILSALYSCILDTHSTKGVVNSVQGNALTVTLDNGGSAVLDCSYIPNLTLQAKDTITFSYVGDLKANAYMTAALKTGVEEDTTFSGTIVKIIGDELYVLTNDNNIFVFKTQGSVVNGKSTILTENSTVTITYTGDLYANPVAVVIQVNNAAPATPVPTPTPKPTATPAPKDRSTSGVVTSAIGNWVTLNSMVFDVTGKIVCGNPAVGVQSDIYFKDYGNGTYVVTYAYFYNQPEPTVTPTYSTDGIITSLYEQDANNVYFTVNGVYLYMNTRGAGGSGRPEVGGHAYVEYQINNGMNCVTYATFYPAPTPDPTPKVFYFFGKTVTGSGAVDENHAYFILDDGCQYKVAYGNYSGEPKPGNLATGSYTYNENTGELEVGWVTFEEQISPVVYDEPVYEAVDEGVYYSE